MATFSAPEIFARAAQETDSNGCVICNSVPNCPVCAKGETCVQSTRTCQACPQTYCRSLLGNSSPSKANVGGIAGGVIAAILVLLIAGFLFYKFYFKKKLAFNKIHRDGKYYDFDLDDDVEMRFHHNISYDESTQGNTGTELGKASSRSSFATIFTRASNIIPIAYIPGVTVGTATQNKSNIRASTASAQTFDSELIGDRFSKASIVHNPSLTTTAIRAKPKLITVNNMSPESEDQSHDGIPKTAVGAGQLGGVRAVKVDRKKKFGFQQDLIEEEEEEEEEEGAPSKRSPSPDALKKIITDDYDPFILDDGSGSESESEEAKDKAKKEHSADDSTIRSRDSNGSVLLEVEMASHRSTST